MDEGLHVLILSPRPNNETSAFGNTLLTAGPMAADLVKWKTIRLLFMTSLVAFHQTYSLSSSSAQPLNKSG